MNVGIWSSGMILSFGCERFRLWFSECTQFFRFICAFIVLLRVLSLTWRKEKH